MARDLIKEIFEQQDKILITELNRKVIELNDKLYQMHLILAINTDDKDSPFYVYEDPQGEALFRFPDLWGVEFFLKGIEWGRKNDRVLRQMGL